MRIGYFVPEFPGQTHAFFWREMRELRRRGIFPEPVSTRKPSRRIICHAWAEEAMRQTVYLFPPRLGDAIGAAMFMLGCGPAAWWRCVRSIVHAQRLSWSGRLRLLALIPLGALLARRARQRDWVRVHVHSCADAAHIALFARLLSGLPYSLTLHGPLDDYGPNQRQKWAGASSAIVITKTLLEEVRSRLAGHLPEDLQIAPMGVDVDDFRRRQAYQAWTGDGPLRLFACGRLNPCKGYEDLIAAVGLLHARGIDAELHVAGAEDAESTGYKSHLEGLAEQLGLTNRVRLLGPLAEPQVREELERAHLFTLASLHEPLGVVIMEAMAMEVPVVVTSAGGVAELVTHGTNGLMVPAREPAALAKAIAALAADPARAAAIGKAGRETVACSFHSGRSAQVLAAQLWDRNP